MQTACCSVIFQHVRRASLPVVYLIVQVFLWDLDGVVLDSVSVPLVRDLLGHQLFEDEQQQLVVVSAEGQVAGERLRGNKDSRDFMNIRTH